MVGKAEDGQYLYLTDRATWNDGYDFPGITIGRIKKVRGRWYCVAQDTTVELAKAMLKGARA